METGFFLNLNPERRLAMTFSLRKALEILQMAQSELGEWLLEEIEKNPFLELDSFSSNKEAQPDVPAPLHLYEHLQNQIRDHFPRETERKIAELFLERLDERGFLTDPLEIPDSSILNVLQTFDPPGIFARNLQEALILQLRAKKQEKSVAASLVKECYEDLLGGRYEAIKKKLGISEIGKAIADLARLSLRPGASFHKEVPRWISPDLKIEKLDGAWSVELVEDELPLFHIRTEYFDLKGESEEEKEALQTFKTEAKWIFRSLNRRRSALQRIGSALVERQGSFLDHKGPLLPLSVKELSEKLQIHESTVCRALSEKYAATPRGIVPLRSLVHADPAGEEAKEVLKKWIAKEDKGDPLTDGELAEALKMEGIQLARRTIAKYRTQLKIGSSAQRKNRFIPFAKNKVINLRSCFKT